MRQEDVSLLVPGMRIRIADALVGRKLYYSDDPEWMEKWLGQEVIVKTIHTFPHPYIEAEERDEGRAITFYMEEIDCIVEEQDIQESDLPLLSLLEG